MKILGLPVPFTEKALNPVSTRGNFWGWIQESFAGAWQQNVEVEYSSIMKFPAIYACVSLIVGDVAKLRLKLMQQQRDGTWMEIVGANPIFTYPNDYQTRIQFIEQWVTSLLLHGNTYVWKERVDGRVAALHVLDPLRVKVLISELGDVFYQLDSDDLAGIPEGRVTVPASDMIHDRFKPLYHPLVGISPISAAGLAATLGQEILNSSSKFFANGSRPGGLLIAPGPITQDKATALKTMWAERYSGENAGKVAVLGDGLRYEQMAITATDAQLLEQLKLTNELVAMCFHVPAYKIGAGQIPTYQNAAVLNQIYYADCLQTIIENIEASIDKGLELGSGLGVEFDLDDLLRMDAKTQVDTLAAAVGGGIMAPNEARGKMNLKPLEGGDTVYLQMQEHSLAALAKRDAKDDPFAKSDAQGTAEAAAAKALSLYSEKRDVFADDIAAKFVALLPASDPANDTGVKELSEEDMFLLARGALAMELKAQPSPVSSTVVV